MFCNNIILCITQLADDKPASKTQPSELKFHAFCSIKEKEIYPRIITLKGKFNAKRRL
jgi:hypothetical protein